MNHFGQVNGDESPSRWDSVDGEVSRILDEYLRRIEGGERITPAELLAANPDKAAILEPLLAKLVELNRLANGAADVTCAGLAGPLHPISGTLGDFQIVREIGRGGMGVVYESLQLSLQRRVAMKILPFASLLDERRLARFKNEAQAAAHLHHPHIVPVYATGCDRGVHYFAMQYIDGNTLACVVRELRSDRARNGQVTRNGLGQPSSTTNEAVRNDAETVRPAVTAMGDRARFRQIARWGQQAAEGLEHAHRHGIVHRDIKPSNLLVDAQGSLWIADFGLARIDSDSHATTTGDVPGTLRYMSPEQLRGKATDVDHRTDIYSLGATLYELITLEPIVSDDNRDHLVNQVCYREPTPPRRIDNNIPVDLQTIILKAAAKERTDRYNSAAELADDLGRFLADLPVKARPLGTVRRAMRWAARHHVFAILSIVTVISLLGLFLGSWRANLRSQRQLTLIGELQQQTEQAERETRELLKQERRRAHVSRVRAAHQAIINDRFTFASQSLEEGIPRAGESDERDFAWWYLHGLVHCQTFEAGGHAPSARCVAFSPDGEQLAVGDGAGGVQIWSIDTGRQLWRFLDHQGIVGAVRYLDDQHLLSTGDDGRIVLRELGESPRVRAIQQESHGEQYCLAVSPDQRWLASGGDDQVVRLWSLPELELVGELRGHTDWVRSLVFHPSGSRLFSGGSDRMIHQWNLETMTSERSFEGHTGSVFMARPIKNATLMLVDSGELPYALVHERRNAFIGGSS